MELRAVVVLGLHVVEEVRDGLRRGVGVELDADLAGGRVELDLRIGGERGKREGGGKRRGGDQEGTAQHRMDSLGWNGSGR